MIAETQIRELLAESYRNAAFSGQADMHVVTGVLESIRTEMLAGNPYNVWARINLGKYLDNRAQLQQLLLDLKTRHTDLLLQVIRTQLDEAFTHPQDGWKTWLNHYLEAFFCWNGEIHDRLCNEPFPFPEDALVLVDKLRRSNRLVLESRWIDTYPTLEELAQHPHSSLRQKGLLEAILGEIDLYHFLKPAEALQRFQRAEDMITRHAAAASGDITLTDAGRLKRIFAEYDQKTGDLQNSRNKIFEAIIQNGNDTENYLLMGDTYRDEGQLDIAEKWYRDAIGINFLKADPYIRILGIYGNAVKFSEKRNELRQVLLQAEQAEPDNVYNNTVYNGYRDAGSYCSANSDYVKSVEFYEHAIALHPGWVTAYPELGYCLALDKQYDAAAVKVDQSLQIDPTYYDGLLAKAWILEQRSNEDISRGEVDQLLRNAIQVYRQCLEIRPRATWLYNTIGVLYSDLGEHEAAALNYLEAITGEPLNALYQNNLGFAYTKLQQYSAAEQAYQRAMELDPKDASTCNKLGNIYYSQAQFEKAKTCYAAALELSPQTAVYYENLGLANAELENWPDAIAAYRQSLAAGPSWGVYNSLGIAYFRINENENAVEAYKRSIELSPGTAVLFDNLGLAYDKLGNTEAAERAYVKAVEAAPENATYQNRLGVFYSVQNKYEQSIGCFEKAIEFGNGEAVFYENLGLAFAKLERWEPARAAYQKAVDAAPDNSSYENFVGVCLYRLKAFTDAVVHYKKAISLEHDQPLYWENLGLAHEDAQQLPEAKAAYRQLIELAPEVPDYYFRLAVILVKEQNLGEAIEVIRTGVALDPDNLEMLKILGEYEENNGQQANALNTYQHALSIEPQNEYFNFRAGICSFNLQAYEKALSYYQRAIDANAMQPIHPTGLLYGNLAQAYDKLSKKEEAEQAYLAAINHEPENYLLQNSIGIFYYANGDQVKAIEHYLRAIEFGRGEEVLFDNLGLSYEAAGMNRQAIDTYTRALEHYPDNEYFAAKIAELQSPGHTIPDPKG